MRWSNWGISCRK